MSEQSDYGNDGTPESQPWPHIIPIERNTPVPFPTDALGSVADFVRALAIETQTPEDMAAIAALGTMSVATRNRFSVQVSGSWIEQLCLFFIVLLESGNRKSEIMRQATRPIKDYERERAKLDRVELSKWKVQNGLARSELNMTIKLAEGGDSAAATLAEGQQMAVDADREPAITQLIVDDITPEALSVELHRQGGSLAVMSAEGGFFSNIGGRYSSNVPALDVLLKGHAGDMHKVSRTTREGEYIARPVLDVCIFAQPQIATDLGKIAGFDGKGAAARFLPSFPESKVGYREIDSPSVPDAMRSQWAHLIDGIVRLASAMPIDVEDESPPYMLKLADEARFALKYFEIANEERQRPDGDLASIKAWASKLSGALVRIAGVLHVADCIDRGRSPIDHAIPCDTIERAQRIAEYFIPHARLFFEQIGQSGNEAVRLLRDVLLDGTDETTKRELFQQLRKRRQFQTVDTLDRPLQTLEDHGYIRRYRRPAIGSNGGRPKDVIAVNPAARCPQLTQKAQYPELDPITSRLLGVETSSEPIESIAGAPDHLGEATHGRID